MTLLTFRGHDPKLKGHQGSLSFEILALRCRQYYEIVAELFYIGTVLHRESTLAGETYDFRGNRPVHIYSMFALLQQWFCP